MSRIGRVMGRGARRLPRTDNRRNPIRLSLGRSVATVARFRFTGRLADYGSVGFQSSWLVHGV